MIETNPKKLESRLIPYIQFRYSREYLVDYKDLYFTGLYLDYEKKVWKPQTQDYLLKAIDTQIEFLKAIKEIERITEDFNREAYFKWHAERTLPKKLASTIQ